MDHGASPPDETTQVVVRTASDGHGPKLDEPHRSYSVSAMEQNGPNPEFEVPEDRAALTEATGLTFLRYALPSLVGLLAISTASVVDGVFVGHFVGADALATVNLLLPFFTFLFSICLMLAVGGTVRAGRYFGQGRPDAASAIFSKVVLTSATFVVVAVTLGRLYPHVLYSALSIPTQLAPLADEYLNVLSFSLVVQLTTMVIYYFVRLDDSPERATVALVTGALVNIALDFLLVGFFDLGLRGAALATLLAQIIQLGVLLTHFRLPRPTLQFRWRQRDWMEVARAALNGGSEFVNEVSAGIVILVFNHVLLQQSGVEGVAAFAVVQLSVFVSLMLYYGIADGLHPLVSQNFGAGRAQRMREFVETSILSIALVSAFYTGAIIILSDLFLSLVLEPAALEPSGAGGMVSEAKPALVRTLAEKHLGAVWPAFLLSGFNVLMCVYFAAVHEPTLAATVAILRTLLFPLAALGALRQLASNASPLLALPISEAATLLFALLAYSQRTPATVVQRAAAEAAQETYADPEPQPMRAQ